MVSATTEGWIAVVAWSSDFVGPWRLRWMEVFYFFASDSSYGDWLVVLELETQAWIAKLYSNSRLIDVLIDANHIAVN